MSYKQMVTSGRRDEYNEYFKQMQRRKYAERKAQAIAYLGGKCVDCGSTDDLEFDHVDPKTKLFPVTRRLNNGPWDVIMEELDKCVLRDKECHKVRTRLQYSIMRDRVFW